MLPRQRRGHPHRCLWLRARLLREPRDEHLVGDAEVVDHVVHAHRHGVDGHVVRGCRGPDVLGFERSAEGAGRTRDRFTRERGPTSTIRRGPPSFRSPQVLWLQDPRQSVHRRVQRRCVTLCRGCVPERDHDDGVVWGWAGRQRSTCHRSRATSSASCARGSPRLMRTSAARRTGSM